MREIFINAAKDVAWVEQFIPNQGARAMLIIDDPTAAIVIRLYDRREPVFLNQPTKEIKLTGSPANQLSEVLRSRFPPR